MSTIAEPVAAPMMPHLLTECHGLYTAWRPEDPEAALALLPAGLDRPDDAVVSLFQGAQSGPYTSWGGTVSIAHAEVEVDGHDAPDGRSRGRWWALYVNADPWYLAGAHALGVPGAEKGRTEMLRDGAALTATTYRGERPIIRTTARIDADTEQAVGGQLRYLIPGDGFPSILVPYAGVASPVAIADVEFLDDADPSWPLRPRRPIEIAWSLYSPRFSYAFSAPTAVP